MPWLPDVKTGLVVNTYMPRKQIWFSVFLSEQQMHVARELYLPFQTCFLPLYFLPQDIVQRKEPSLHGLPALSSF